MGSSDKQEPEEAGPGSGSVLLLHPNFRLEKDVCAVERIWASARDDPAEQAGIRGVRAAVRVGRWSSSYTAGKLVWL